jgi:hypothetical protein
VHFAHPPQKEKVNTPIPPHGLDPADPSLSIPSAPEPPPGKPLARRSFLKGLGVAGAALVPATSLLLSEAKGAGREFRRGLTQGDVDMLRFLAAAEILETDLWQQYNELGGVQDSEVPGGSGNPAYTAALENLDSDMPQYIHDNTDDEHSHFTFLNAFLDFVGAEPVNLDAFRTLPSSQATGAQQIGRLTNLMNLTVDTSWYVRYRSQQNPDFGATFPQAVTIVNQPAIPLNDADTPPGMAQPVPPTTPQQQRMQAIADTAGFHFATIEQGGSSLYGSFVPMATAKVVLRILYAIGGSEVAHFQTWHDKAGNAVSQPLAGVTDPVTGTRFPDLNAPPLGGELFQTNLIMPEPCQFIRQDLPPCSIIRPTLRKNAGARAVVAFLTAMNLFQGQSAQFFATLNQLAAAADKARRQAEDVDDAIDALFDF